MRHHVEELKTPRWSAGNDCQRDVVSIRRSVWFSPRQTLPVVGCIAFLAVILLSQVSSAPAQEKDWGAVIAQARRAVVQIRAVTAKGLTFGSGFITTSDGRILTAAHVVEGATRITVIVEDKWEYSARVVLIDRKADVAILKISASGLHTLAFAPSQELVYGQELCALGYPRPEIGVGLIPAQGYYIGHRTRPEGIYIQFEASPLDKGHSGGALIDQRGRVVGMVIEAWVDGVAIHKIAVATETMERIIAGRMRPIPTPDTPQLTSNMFAGISLLPAFLVATKDNPAPIPILPFLMVGWSKYNEEGYLTRVEGFNIGLGFSFRYYGAGLQPGRVNFYWGWGTIALILPYIEAGLLFAVGNQLGLTLHFGLFYYLPYLGLSVHF